MSQHDGAGSPAPTAYGMTLQLQVADIAAARDFYTALCGRPPGFEPHDDFLEWPVIPGQETWIQIVGTTDEPVPCRNRVRFGVRDIAAARERLLGLGFGLEPTPIQTLPGIVSFLNFDDPWHNALGYYQDLVPSEQAPTMPGTSVHDESLFTDDVPDPTRGTAGEPVE